MRLKVKIEEKNGLPLVKYDSVSGEHYALLDTGSDNTITYYNEETGDNNVTVVGFGGEKKSQAQSGVVEFDMVCDDGNSLVGVKTEAIMVDHAFFKVFEDNGLPEVDMILGMNFFRKYKVKIDIKNKIMSLG